MLEFKIAFAKKNLKIRFKFPEMTSTQITRNVHKKMTFGRPSMFFGSKKF